MSHRHPGRSFVALVALALAVTSSGCSWAFMSRRPEVVAAPNYPLDCTTSRAAPVLDTICAGYFVVNTIALASGSCDSTLDSGSCSSTRTGGMVLSASLAALCALSASSGYGNANQCSQAKDLNALCITGDLGACQALRPGWTPRGGVPMPAPAYHPSLPGATPVPTVAPAPDAESAWERQ